MSEIDLIQAYYGAINLAYTTSTWWLTLSTALVVATYFAGKHIPPWLMIVILLLYATEAFSVIYEVTGYSSLSLEYAQRLAQLRGGSQVLSTSVANGNGLLNSIANYAVIGLGSLAAAAFSFVTWRGAREEATKPVPIP